MKQFYYFVDYKHLISGYKHYINNDKVKFKLFLGGDYAKEH